MREGETRREHCRQRLRQRGVVKGSYCCTVSNTNQHQLPSLVSLVSSSRYLGRGEVHVGACVGEHSLSVPLRCGGCETDGHKPLESVVRETLYYDKEEGGRRKEEG